MFWNSEQLLWGSPRMPLLSQLTLGSITGTLVDLNMYRSHVIYIPPRALNLGSSAECHLCSSHSAISAEVCSPWRGPLILTLVHPNSQSLLLSEDKGPISLCAL